MFTKITFCFFLLLLPACSTVKPRVVRMSDVPGTVLTEPQSVRSSENIKSYPMGRYVDPGSSRIMHEAHPVYRVESTAKWNLYPDRAVGLQMGPPLRLKDSASHEKLLRDELYLELARQKETTRKVIDGSEIVSKHLGQLGRQLQGTQAISEELVRLKQDVNLTMQRINAFEEELRRKQDIPGSTGNDSTSN